MAWVIATGKPVDYHRPLMCRTTAILILLFAMIAMSSPADAVDPLLRARAELKAGHPARAERVSADALTASPGNIDLMIVHAEALRALNRNPEALQQAERAVAADPTRDDARRIRRILRQELQSSEAGISLNYDHYSDSIDPLRELALFVRRNTTFGAGVVRVAHAHRPGLDGDLLELEAYPRYRSTSAYFAADYAQKAGIYPNSRYAVEVYQRIPAGIEASLGYRRLNFDERTELYTGSIAYYHRAWSLSTRVYRESGPQSTNAWQFAARRYFADDSRYVGLRIGKGATRDELRRAADLESLASNEIAVETMLLFQDRWAVNIRGGAGRETILGRRITHATLSTGLGFRF